MKKKIKTQAPRLNVAAATDPLGAFSQAELTVGPVGVCCAAFTDIVAGGVDQVAAVQGDVNRKHLRPAVSGAGFGEVA